MSAVSDIRDKPFENWMATEKCIVECWEMQGLEWMAEAAAEELATLRARLAEADEIILALAQGEKREMNVLIGEAKDYVGQYEVEG